MDTVGNKEAKAEIAMIKVAAPNAACTIVDWAIQMFGGGGTSNDHLLTAAYANARLLRLADGPDEVQDRKSVVRGKSVSVRVDFGGRRIIKKKKSKYIRKQSHNK